MAAESRIGVTGLAVMGANLARNIARHGMPVAVHNRTTARTDEFMAEYGGEGTFTPTETMADFVQALQRPRKIIVMVKAGVPLPDAMIVVAESTRNKVYERAIVRVREAMLQGEGIAGPITRTQLFPSAVTQMMRVGENTGTLDTQLETAAAFRHERTGAA